MYTIDHEVITGGEYGNLYANKMWIHSRLGATLQAKASCLSFETCAWRTATLTCDLQRGKISHANVQPTYSIVHLSSSRRHDSSLHPHVQRV
jgi:hypothetical protein